MLTLSLLGCSLLEPLRIECTAEMPCADDTAATDGADTGEVVGPTRGFVALVRGGNAPELRVYDADGIVAGRYIVASGAEGPVDATSDGGVVAGANGQLWFVNGTGSFAVEAGQPLEAVHLDAGVAWGFGPQGAVRAETSVTWLAGAWPSDGVVALRRDDGAGWLAAWTDGNRTGIALHALDGEGGSTVAIAALTGDTARLRDVFTGPGGDPYGCSDVGAVYDLNALANGTTTPTSFPNLALNGVTACAWDPGDESWLLFAPSTGFVRMDGAGRATVVIAPPADGVFVHGNFD